MRFALRRPSARSLDAQSASSAGRPQMRGPVLSRGHRPCCRPIRRNGPGHACRSRRNEKLLVVRRYAACVVDEFAARTQRCCSDVGIGAVAFAETEAATRVRHAAEIAHPDHQHTWQDEFPFRLCTKLYRTLDQYGRQPCKDQAGHDEKAAHPAVRLATGEDERERQPRPVPEIPRIADPAGPNRDGLAQECRTNETSQGFRRWRYRATGKEKARTRRAEQTVRIAGMRGLLLFFAG